MKDLFTFVPIFFAILLVVLFGAIHDLSAMYVLDAKKGEKKIKHFKVFSERCSGSNYTRALLRRNIKDVQEVDEYKYCWNHFSPWFGYEERYFGPREDYTFEGSDDTLFVILFRNPYDWLRSFNQTTFFAAPELETDFSNFIRTKWDLNYNYETVRKWRSFHPLMDYNPENGLPFKNVIELRTAKIKNMLQIPNRVENYYIINYENARNFPMEILNEIATIFELELNSKLDPIPEIRGNLKANKYVPKKYPPISHRDLLYINLYLNEKLENSLGYQLASEVD